MAERTKPCTKCGEQKPLADFYKHAETIDGLRNSCKTCWAKATKSYGHTSAGRTSRIKTYKTRQHNGKIAAYKNEYVQRPEVKEHDRQRRQTNEYRQRRIETCKKYRQSPEVQSRLREYRKQYRQDHRQQKRLYSFIQNAVLHGRIAKPIACGHCGQQRRLHAHHNDYGKPFDIQWLCFSCHRLIHLQSLTA